jgi:DNA repair exonuclease SbcCD nuclease subunit
MYIIPGNHDCSMKWSSLVVANSFKSGDYIHLLLEPTTVKVDNELITFVPHLPNMRITDYESYLKSVVRNSKVTTIVSHALTGEAVHLSDSVLSESNNVIPFKHEWFPPAELYLLGHVHNYQVLKKKDYKIVYPGSVIMNDFGERHDLKCFVEINNKKITPKLFTTKVRDYCQININLLNKDTYTFDETKMKKLKDKIVKVVVTTDDNEKVNELYIRNSLNTICYVSRFEVKNVKKDLEVGSVEGQDVVMKEQSHNKLLKKWLTAQQESEDVKEMAYKIGKGLVQC